MFLIFLHFYIREPNLSYFGLYCHDAKRRHAKHGDKSVKKQPWSYYYYSHIKKTKRKWGRKMKWQDLNINTHSRRYEEGEGCPKHDGGQIASYYWHQRTLQRCYRHKNICLSVIGSCWVFILNQVFHIQNPESRRKINAATSCVGFEKSWTS